MNNKNSLVRDVLKYLFFLSIILFSISLFFGSFFTTNEYFNFFSILIFLLLVFYLSKNSPYFFWAVLFFIFSYFLNIVSNLFIETGIFISEQNRYGELTGGTVRLSLSIVFFLFVSCVFVSFLNKLIKVPKNIYISKNSFFVFSFSLYLFLCSVFVFVLFVYGVPLLMEVPRSSFLSDNPLAAKVRVLFMVFSPLLGYSIFLNSGFRSKFLILFLFLSIFLLFLSSDKFSGPIAIFFGAVSGYKLCSLSCGEESRVGVKGYVLSFSFILICMLVVSFVYATIENLSGEEIVDKILGRIFGLQGHIWHRMDTLSMTDSITISVKEFWGMDRPAMHSLMYRVADSSLVSSMLKAGVTFTSGFPAVIFLWGGGVEFVFILFLSALFFSLFVFLGLFFVRVFSFLGLIWFCFAQKIFFNVLVMGNFEEVIFRANFLIFSGFLLFLFEIYKSGFVNEK